MVEHKIKIPNSLELLFSAPLLLYRKLRFGYAFRRIPLTKGKFALVSPSDFPAISQYNWYARKSNWTCYATFCRKINGRTKSFDMHRIIMNPPPGLVIDHIDGNGLNNCRSNLRIATPAQNSRNTCAKKNGQSKYKGVSPEKRRYCWRATLTINGKQMHIGQFASEIQAAKAYDKAAKKYHGNFARLNFPPNKSPWQKFINRLRQLKTKNS
ncbi:MAG: HNH endonuclease [Phycisphaerae bacterium]|jgi:hypothetical protein